MGVNIYYDQVHIKYFEDFKRAFSGGNYSVFRDYEEWMFGDRRKNDDMPHLCLRDNYFPITKPIEYSPFIEKDLRKEMSTILVFGEGKNPYVASTGDYRNYLTREKLAKYYTVLEEVNFTNFKIYSASFLEEYRQKYRYERKEKINAFVDEFLNDSNINWDGKYKEISEREKAQMERLSGGIDQLFKGANKESKLVDEMKDGQLKKTEPKNESVRGITEEDRREYNLMLSDLDDCYSAFMKFMIYCKDTLKYDDRWLYIH